MSVSNPKPLNITDAQRDTGVLNRNARSTYESIQAIQTELQRQRTAADKLKTQVNTTTASTALASNTSGVSVSENGYIIDGVLYSELTCTYTAPSPLGTFAGVFLVVKNYRGSADLVKVAENAYTGTAGGTGHFKVTLQRTNETITCYFVAKNSQGGSASDWTTSPNTTVLLDGNASAPNAPTGVAATAQQLGVALSWTENTENNLKAYNVYRNTSNTFGTAINIATVGASGLGSAAYFDKTAVTGTTYWYWITAVNTAKQESSASSAVNTAGVTVSLDNDVADGSTYARPLASRLSSGKPWIDFSESIHANKNVDNIADGSVYLRNPQMSGSPEALANANFEASSSLPVPGWSVAPGGTFSYETTSPQSGTQSLKLTYGIGGAGFGYSNKNFPVLPGEVYNISGYVKGDGTFAPYIALRCTLQNGTNTWLSVSGTSSTSWQFVSGQVTIPANSVYAVFALNSNTNTTCNQWYDNLKCVKVHSLDNEVQDGSTYVRPAYVNPDHTFHVSSVLLPQGSIANIGPNTFSYTSTTTSISWSWTAFSIYAPDGTVYNFTSGSQNFTGLSASHTYHFGFYCTLSGLVVHVAMSTQSSGTGTESVQIQAQTYNGDGNVCINPDATAATPSSGTGGGGGGGFCFSGDAKVKTPSGFVRFDELPEEFEIINLTGRHTACLLVHEASIEPMLAMPDGALVTKEHLMLHPSGGWQPASAFFTKEVPTMSRTVYNMHVHTDNPDDMHYILETGHIAHNIKKQNCFDGATKVKTSGGIFRFDELPEEFTITDRQGRLFQAKLIRHYGFNEQMFLMPDGAKVTGVHLVRRQGEKCWHFAGSVFPEVSGHSDILYNLHIEDSDHYALANGFEAHDMKGMF